MLTEGLKDDNAQRSIYGVLCNYNDCDYDKDMMMMAMMMMMKTTMMKHFLVNMH